MLRRMIVIRRFDEIALSLVQGKEIHGVVHPYIGQERSAVGICSALRAGDRVASNHRGHGHCIAAGTAVDRMMAELFGRETGCCKGKGGSMHIADFDIGMLGANGIVGGGLPTVVGAAFSDDLDGSDNVNVGFFGDGALGQGLVYECLNMAALWKLPVLFVCENNGIAGSTPIDMIIGYPNVTGIAGAHGVPGETVDASDVTAVHAATAAAVERMRAGSGPYLIECALIGGRHTHPESSRFLTGAMLLCSTWHGSGTRLPACACGSKLTGIATRRRSSGCALKSIES
jgi:pyruvate dehydrogenase E1 component alpha subunit